jgi:translocation and assembly module TamB
VKRRIALGFLAFLLVAIGAGLAIASTPWAGRKLCAIAEERIRAGAGIEVAFRACRIRPLRLELVLDGVRVGPEAHPIFTAQVVSASLAPLQALSRRVHLAEVRLVEPRVSLVLPPPDPAAPPAPCPPPILEQFHVRRLQVEDGAVDLQLASGERIIVGRVDVGTRSEWIPTDLKSLAVGGRRSHVTVNVGPTLVEAGGRQTLLEEGYLDADFAFDLSRLAAREFRLQGEGVHVSARGTVANLCRPRLGLEVSAEAPLPAVFALLRARGVRSDGTAVIRARLSGPLESLEAAGDVELTGARVNVYAPGSVKARFKLKGRQLELPAVEIPFAGGGGILGKATIQLASPPSMAAEARVERIEFADLVDRLGLHGAHVMMKLDGSARVQGPLVPLRLGGEVAIDVQDFRVLDHPWERYAPGEETILDLARARLEAPVTITAGGVEMAAGARATVGEDTLGLTGDLSFDDARGFRLQLDGGVDLAAVRHVASVPVAGRATFRGAVRAEPYGPPHIEGAMQARDFHFLELDLGEMSAAVQMAPDLVLRVREGAGRKGDSHYAVEAAVDLGASPIRVLPSRATARGRLHDLFAVVLPWLPATRHFDEAIDGAVQLEMPFQGVVPRIDMGFEGTLGEGRLWGRAFESGRISARIEKGERAVVERAELRRGGARLSGGGTVTLAPPTPWDLRVDVGALPLAGLDLPGREWAGTLEGRATFGGSVDEPVIRFEGRGDGVGVAGVSIGAVNAQGSLRGRSLELAGSTGGVRFRGRAQIEGAMPYQAEADIDLEDLNRFAPGGPPAGLRAEARGRAQARGTLEKLGESEARLDLETLRVGYADFRVGNKDPVAISVAGGAVEVESFTLEGANTAFDLSGTRDAEGTLDLAAQGSLDLRLLAGLVPALTRTRGQITLDATFGGTLDEPLIVGSGRIADAGFRLRELPIEFAGMGGELSFSQNLVLFDRVQGTLNGGGVRLRGELALRRFVPTRIRVQGELGEVPMTIPSWLPSVVSGRVDAFGSPDAMTLSGNLRVLRASYTERFDLDKRIVRFGAGTGRAEVRPYDKSEEWLRFDLHFAVDGDARIDNDLARGQARGEFTLTGTLASYGLVGNLALLPGARAFYRGNEFVLSRAVVDMTDRSRVRIVLDVSGEAALKDYRVFLHLFGDLEDPKLQLSSAPVLSQQDILTLISMGYTSRDVTASGSSIGAAATAAAAQALFSVSGLEGQLRRFVPPGGTFQDFSVRLTSAYSKTTMTVEPRWEFETKALDNRLRVRYQAPLSGQSRGQKAQVEYRLNDRAGVQLQWDNDNIDVAGGDLGADLKLRWEWKD